MVKDDITRNFEFIYTGVGGRANIDRDRDLPLSVIRDLGGRERIIIIEKGNERIGNASTQSDYEFRVMSFPDSRMRAYVTRETFPDSKEDSGRRPSDVTRVRLCNYDLESEEAFTREVSLALDKLPRIS